MAGKARGAVDELAKLETPEAFLERPEIARFYPSRSSFNWVRFQHREVLDRHQAIVKIAGRLYVHPERFAKALLEIAARGATAE